MTQIMPPPATAIASGYYGLKRRFTAMLHAVKGTWKPIQTYMVAISKLSSLETLQNVRRVANCEAGFAKNGSVVLCVRVHLLTLGTK